MSWMRRRNTVVAALALTGAVLVTALSAALLAQGAESKHKSKSKDKSESKHRSSSNDRRKARATLVDATGEKVGTVRFERRGRSRALRVTVRVRNLSPGFHGFHVHAVGKCEAPSFMTAGPHLNEAGDAHPGHAGDMPPLLVMSGARRRPGSAPTASRWPTCATRTAAPSSCTRCPTTTPTSRPSATSRIRTRRRSQPATRAPVSPAVACASRPASATRSSGAASCGA